MKVLIILGTIFLVFAVLCCGGISIIYYQLKNAVSTDPNVVKATTGEIAQIDIPDPLKPKMSMNMKNVLGVNKVIRQMVIYNDGTEKTILALIAVGMPSPAKTRHRCATPSTNPCGSRALTRANRRRSKTGRLPRRS